jgi:hypothetical protein
MTDEKSEEAEAPGVEEVPLEEGQCDEIREEERSADEMTELKREEIKAMLIGAGFWWAGDEGDPTIDASAIGELLRRIERRVAAGFFLRTDFADKEMTKREVRIVGPGIDHAFSADKDVAIAICQAALELPGFLKQHPEAARAR